MITVYTCVVNDHDYLRAPAVVFEDTRYICFSDRPIEPVWPWEIQPAYCPLPVASTSVCDVKSVPPPAPNASRVSRIPKILPHLHFDAEYSVWHDANFVMRVGPRLLIEKYLKRCDIAMFGHPARKTVAEEVKVLLAEHIGDPIQVLAQQTAWLHMGAPCGLWAGGLIVRRHTMAVRDFNETWWSHFKAGSTRDQLALPMAKYDTGIEIETIPGIIYDSQLMGFHWHAAWRVKADNARYETGVAEYQMRRRRLEDLCRES